MKFDLAGIITYNQSASWYSPRLAKFLHFHRSPLLIHRHHYILFFLFLLYALLLTPLGDYKNPNLPHPGFYNVQKIDMADDTGYYSYLRSGIIEGDFDFFNEKNFWQFDAVTSTGYTANYWYIGAPILWLPFFLIGHLIAGIYSLLGYPVATDGYSFPYHSLTFIGSACLTFLGMIFCYEMLRKLFSRKASLTATILVFTATCLPYYSFIRNRMSHSGDACIAFIFVLLFLMYRENRDRPFSFFVLWGALSGLLVDLRYVSLVYAVFPLGMFVSAFFDKQISSDSKQRTVKQFGTGLAAFLIVVSPQLASWKTLHGGFFPTNPYPDLLEPTVSSFISAVARIFVDPVRGLIFVEPLWIIGLAGIVLVFLKDRWLGGLSLLVFAGLCVPILVIQDSASFGHRYLLPALPVLALGVGRIIEIALQKGWGKFLTGLGALMAGWLYVLLLNYKILLPYNDPQFALRSLQNIPKIFKELAFLRPTTFPDLLVHGKLTFSDFYDLFFLLIFPILFAGLAWFSLSLLNKFRESAGGIKNRIIKFSSIGFLAFNFLLMVFIIGRHPGLPQETVKERLQTASVSVFLKSFPNFSGAEKKLRQAEQISPNDETTHIIRGDFYFMLGKFPQAQKHYLNAVKVNENSTAGFQLDRIEVLTNKKVFTPEMNRELEKGDPTGEASQWMGIFFLDRNRNPAGAIKYFRHSLTINPNQKNAPAMKNLIYQLRLQTKRLIRKKIQPEQLPPIYLHILNTKINEIRLSEIPLDMAF